MKKKILNLSSAESAKRVEVVKWALPNISPFIWSYDKLAEQTSKRLDKQKFNKNENESVFW